MQLAFSELPLVLFTTLSPMGAGAFGLLALAFLTTKFSDEQLKKIDRLTAVPLAAVALGFICSFFHLANPLNAPQALAGLGSSPLSNEILAGVVFTVVAVIYWILAITGRLNDVARKGLSLAVAVLAAIFAISIGMAYMIDTIVAWYTPFVPLQMLGYLLLGGSSFGVLILGFSGSLDAGRESSFTTATIAVVIVGALLGIVALIVQVMGVSGMENALQSGSELVSEALGALVIAVVCLLGAATLCALVLFGINPASLTVAALLVAAIGIFFGRVAFYAVELSVGLYVGL